MSSLDQRRFLFVTGKGGVGKSTVAAALALGMARRGRRVLLVASDQKERLSTLLGSAPLGPELAEVAPGVVGVRPEPARALREYGAMILKNRLITDAVFDSKYTRGFFAGVPGLSEWAVLGKAWFHATEQLDDGRPRFDTVLFDAPATGHGLDMLRVPKILVEITPPGVLRRDAQAAWDMFRDPRRSGVVVVSLPEDMPTNETLELTSALRSELGLPLARLVINAVIPNLFSIGERAALTAAAERLGAEPGDRALAVAARRCAREALQAESLARLAPLDPEAIRLPRLLRDAANPGAVAELAAYL
jgi:anion-transporting  ArsA/GET3 family ATPase